MTTDEFPVYICRLGENFDNLTRSFVARCDCGWEGKDRGLNVLQALTDSHEHNKEGWHREAWHRDH